MSRGWRGGPPPYGRGRGFWGPPGGFGGPRFGPPMMGGFDHGFDRFGPPRGHGWRGSGRGRDFGASQRQDEAPPQMNVVETKQEGIDCVPCGVKLIGDEVRASSFVAILLYLCSS